jgi:hypothetical protein
MRIPKTIRGGARPSSCPDLYRRHGWRLPAKARRGQSGSVLIIIFILLSLVAALVASNGRVLYHLEQELRLLNRRQQQELDRRFAAPEKGATNAVGQARGTDRVF